MANKKNPQLEEHRKIQIIVAVFKLLGQDSYRNMSLEKVARESGISKGLVSYYFKGKEALILETMRFVDSNIMSQLLGIAMEDAPASVRVEKFIDTLFPSREDVEQWLRFHAEVWSFAKSSPSHLKQVRLFYEDIRKICLRMSQKAKEEGFLKNKDPKKFDHLINALIEGYFLQVFFWPTLSIEEVKEQINEVIEMYFS